MTFGIALHERAFGPSFFLLAGFVFALLTSSVTGLGWWWSGVAALTICLLLNLPHRLPLSLLTWAVFLYVFVLGVNALILSPAYSVEGAYFIAYLAISFMAFSRLDDKTTLKVYRGVVVIGVLLALWGLVQHFTGLGYRVDMFGRANTLFYTPNSFAAMLNLLLLPLIVAYVRGKTHPLLLTAILLLFAGLLATQSKGGYLAFIAGFLFVLVYTGRQDIKAYQGCWAKLLLGVMILILLVGVYQPPVAEIRKQLGAIEFMDRFGLDVQPTVVSNAQRFEALLERGDRPRVVLYQIAWGVIKLAPWTGHGYFNFPYFFERDKAPPFLELSTHFVHNDYLQIWLETGVVGLAALLLMITTVYVALFRARSRVGDDRVLWLCACGAAMTTQFAHALVDFTLYLPVLLLLLGAYLGTANRIMFPATSGLGNSPTDVGWIAPMVRFNEGLSAVAALAFLVWLALPVVAVLYAGKAAGLAQTDYSDKALALYATSRRLAPYQAQYYSAPGDIHFKKAIKRQDKQSAEQADRLYTKGIAVNAYEPVNRLRRLELHRDHRHLLSHPIAKATLLAWADWLHDWRPHDATAQAEYVRTLVFAGLKKDAERALKAYRVRFPQAHALERLERAVSEMSNGGV